MSDFLMNVALGMLVLSCILAIVAVLSYGIGLILISYGLVPASVPGASLACGFICLMVLGMLLVLSYIVGWILRR